VLNDHDTFILMTSFQGLTVGRRYIRVDFVLYRGVLSIFMQALAKGSFAYYDGISIRLFLHWRFTSLLPLTRCLLLSTFTVLLPVLTATK
jgi:hypothetical protein